MRGFEKRMLKEASKLTARANKIKLFMMSERFNKLPKIARKGLKNSLNRINANLFVLRKRIEKNHQKNHLGLIP